MLRNAHTVSGMDSFRGVWEIEVLYGNMFVVERTGGIFISWFVARAEFRVR